ncbi:MAG: hypothetical protein Kow00121_43660 [Elainellaceae cyanobacterium]
MFKLLEATVQPLMLNSKVLDVAYDLYLQAPQDSYPLINLKELSQKTGASLLECRNAIVEANRLGRFPNCTLQS